MGQPFVEFFELLGEGSAGGLGVSKVKLIGQDTAMAMRPFKGIDKGRRLIAARGLAQSQRTGLKIARAVGDENGGFGKLRGWGNAF